MCWKLEKAFSINRKQARCLSDCFLMDLHNDLCTAAGVKLAGWGMGCYSASGKDGVAEECAAESPVPALPQEAARSQLTGLHFLCTWPAQEDSSDRLLSPFSLEPVLKLLSFCFL